MATVGSKMQTLFVKRPIFTPLTSLSRRFPFARQSYTTQAAVATTDSEGNDLYPPIKAKYPPGNWDDFDPGYAWHIHRLAEECKQIPRAKERLENLAGEAEYLMYVTRAYDRKPKTLDYKQFITKTHLINTLPSIYGSVNIDESLASLICKIEEAFAEENDRYKFKYDRKRVRSTEIIKTKAHDLTGRVLSKLIPQLSCENAHLLTSELDESVRCESFWRKGGFDSENIKARAKWLGMLSFQHLSELDWQIRTELPLPEFISLDDAVCTEAPYPILNYAPYFSSVTPLKRRPVSVAGHWIGAPCEFSHLAILCDDPSHAWFTEHYGEEAAKEKSLNAAVTAGFGLCAAQAHNQGFNWLLDTTYPFTAQLAITNGRFVRFAAYQLNTLELWKNDSAQPLRNICWATEELPLYETIEDGKVKGLNEDACKQLAKMLLLKSSDRGGIDFRPYLPEDPSPVNAQLYMNHVGEPKLEVPKIGRWQYPRNAIYF